MSDAPINPGIRAKLDAELLLLHADVAKLERRFLEAGLTVDVACTSGMQRKIMLRWAPALGGPWRIVIWFRKNQYTFPEAPPIAQIMGARLLPELLRNVVGNHAFTLLELRRVRRAIEDLDFINLEDA